MGVGGRGQGSALELVEARLAHPHWLLGGRRQGVPGRALGAEDVAAMPAVVLDGDRERGSGSERVARTGSDAGLSVVRERRVLPCAR